MSISATVSSKQSDTGSQNIRSLIVLSLAALFIFLIFDAVATRLNSLRGEAGIVVMAVVVVTIFVVERVLYKTDFRTAVTTLGLGVPSTRAILTALAIGAAVLAVVPLFSAVTGAPFMVVPNVWWLALGIFAQGGIAEELLFRGFVFGHLRRGRTFWRAAWLSMIPFAAAHVPMFFFQPPAIAAMSLLLALVSSLPLAWLYERGNRTIWAPAIVHASIQGIKLVVFPEAYLMTAALTFMLGAALIPFAAFLLRPQAEPEPAQAATAMEIQKA